MPCPARASPLFLARTPPRRMTKTGARFRPSDERVRSRRRHPLSRLDGPGLVSLLSFRRYMSVGQLPRWRRSVPIDLLHAGHTVLAAFLPSLVEFVEALTVVLAVGAVRGWRSALGGSALAMIVLLLLVVALGPLLTRIPLAAVQLALGALLLLFGMRWLRKAILRSAGVIPLHDEDAIFAAESAELAGASAGRSASLDWVGGLTAFKAVLLEGLEVVFIVIA